jgi:halocyanin-like protein
MREKQSRRRFVQGLGVVAATVSLAGCSGGDGDGGDGDSGDGDGGDGDGGSAETPASTATPAPTATDTPAGTPAGSDTPAPTATPTGSDGESGGEVANYLSDVGNFDGSVADRTGQGEVTVEVGADGNGGGFAFGPAAVRVDAGTTVVWNWVGKGGLHNVVAEDGTFDSGDPVSGSSASFEYTFEETGTYLYYCSPHKALGMKGAVEVV